MEVATIREKSGTQINVRYSGLERFHFITFVADALGGYRSETLHSARP